MSFEINLTIKSDEITATEVDSLTTLLNSFKGEKEAPKEEAPKKTRRSRKPKVEEPKVEDDEALSEEPKVEEPKVEDDEALSEELLKELRAHAVKLISANKDSVLKGVLAKYGVKAISKLPKSGAEELLAESAE